MKNSILIIAAMIAFTITNISAQSTLQTTAVTASSIELLSSKDMGLITAPSELSEYLSNHVQYPSQYVEYAITGTSTVSITFNAYGLITSYEIIKSLGPQFDNEIHKALNKLDQINVSPNLNKEYTVVMPIRFTM